MTWRLKNPGGVKKKEKELMGFIELTKNGTALRRTHVNGERSVGSKF